MSYSDWPKDVAAFFENVRLPNVGEEMILVQNIFVEQMLPASVLRNLTEQEMAVYNAPYLTPGESRRPTLTWPRQIPINGTPPEVADVVTTYSAWMGENEMPKLLISAIPGILLNGEKLELARTWKNQEEVTVDGIHFIQEDSPNEIAEAIENWLEGDTFPQVLAESTSTSGPDDSSGPTTMQTTNGCIYLWFLFATLLLRKVW
ncbi:Haloalkane dehalogenase 3 [Seminavis robusta]|uniref:Haloalkane dehalogenase 3 n=1 Tax=Seminavis robusta TaxID=568900 RepID=A0A9N8DLH5_9STRA|nr:Haloalkane dehalogenase 3 [Seminavis robusta]|eukprot:Sro190_g081880.1 Haloalkane dehalogenase 3 (204) ;mRNA; r:58848-59459